MVKKIIEYDVKADVLTINLIEDFKVVEDKLLDNDVVASFDENGKIVQIQVFDASKKGLIEILINLLKSKKYLLSKLTEQNK